ncbi:MAG: hypothetical protein HY332_12695, partial [Chloroflexi bacterium]|nr:hypothetical protein [Chloroflexota bacterium]
MSRSRVFPLLRRCEFNRLAAGAGALAGLAPHLQPPVAGAAPGSAMLPSVEMADAFGVNEAFKAEQFALKSGAGWTRWTVQWFNVQQNPGDFNVHYFRDEKGRSILEAQVQAGIKVAAMVLGTPEWAAETPGIKTGTSVPTGLYEPVFVDGKPNPANTWGAFMFQLADTYKGLMDVFEIWNEVEIPSTGSNAVYNTWAGSAADYYQLLKVASEAAKAANPDARIATSPYSYFKDKEAGGGATLPWWEEFTAAAQADPAGASVFDVVALNMYRNPHDLWDRVHGGVPQLVEAADRVGFRRRLAAMGAQDKALWLTEINAMPFDDEVPGWNPADKNDGFRITMDEQASYVLQAYALALCAGYEKVFFQALQDDPYPVPDELWGLVRFHDDRANDDPARARPGFTAYQLAAHYLGNAERAELYIRTRPDPRNYKQYASRFEWAGHLAMFQKGDQRTSVVWNGTDQPLNVSLQPWGVEAVLVNKYGEEMPAPRDASGRLGVTLEPASRHFDLFGGDPPGYYYIGG